MGWTDASKDSFKELWEDQKLSAVNIAITLTQEYGEIITRNAVLGMRLRLNLPLRGVSAADRAKNFIPRPRAPKSTKTRFDRPPEFKPEPEPEPQIFDLEIPVGSRKTIMQLDEGDCRWPVGEPGSAEFFYCGMETGKELSYCAYHCRRAYQTASSLRERRKAA